MKIGFLGQVSDMTAGYIFVGLLQTVISTVMFYTQKCENIQETEKKVMRLWWFVRLAAMKASCAGGAKNKLII